MASDRPLARKFWKLAARLAYGSRRAHAQDWAPSLVIERAPYGPERVVMFRGASAGSLMPASYLGDLAARNITIVGSGPSVGSADLSSLSPRSTILLNGALSLIPDRVAQPLAIAVEDERFVYRHFRAFLEGLDRSIPCLLSVAAIRALLEHDPTWLVDRPVLLIDNLLKPYGGDRRELKTLTRMITVEVDLKTGAGISLDPDLGVFQAGSVFISALQFALFYRPKILGFIGIDIANALQPRFYEKGTAKAFSGVAEAEDRILAHVRLAKSVGERQTTVFVNYSPFSSLAKCGIAFSDRLLATPL
ncbi:hypothetical protein C8J36_101410 [Rhizobium sp. PP-F2F-G48]|uniref:glycosyl transferase n=1 Tax=Rhizobium sp. PP-F2F-G48 TaxID=2135651 RepID=UPI0010512BFD|nr:glycosyl transferase [Rhizobium sp. PP-F2F-G48]TCM58507.1 hypothetical protein C8J36_101410 [Rhizobium sp. PP-F2F-G48]